MIAEEVSVNLNLKALDRDYIFRLAETQNIYVAYHFIEMPLLKVLIRAQIVYLPWVSLEMS